MLCIQLYLLTLFCKLLHRSGLHMFARVGWIASLPPMCLTLPLRTEEPKTWTLILFLIIIDPPSSYIMLFLLLLILLITKFNTLTRLFPNTGMGHTAWVTKAQSTKSRSWPFNFHFEVTMKSRYTGWNQSLLFQIAERVFFTGNTAYFRRLPSGWLLFPSTFPFI